MSRHLALLRAAAGNVARNATVYAVASSGLLLPLALLLSGLAIAEGLRAQALDGVERGPDVYCTWDVFGREGAVPRERIADLAAIDGVVRAVPRIIGRLPLGKHFAVVVGVPAEALQGGAINVEGALPREAGEVLVGRELARAEGLAVGQRLLLEASSYRVLTVSGITSSTSSLWGVKAIVGEIEEMAELFGQPNAVSDVCLYTRPGYAGLVAEAVQRVDPRFRVQTKELVRRYVLAGMTRREGLFAVLFALALALGIVTFALFTYLGHVPRRREIGLLKAEGWRTADVLEMVALENVLVSVLVSSLALVLAAVWVRVLGAPLLAGFFVADLPAFPTLALPARFLPLPAAAAFVLSLTVTMTGSIHATWRTAVTPPVEALR